MEQSRPKSREFVAARDDARGVLVPSAFAGAAQELDQAIIIDPYDVDAFATALGQAIDMPIEEQARRMTAMRRVVAQAVAVLGARVGGDRRTPWRLSVEQLL